MIGATLAGRYTVVRLLGEGGMGAVYEARHTGTGARVALKVITSELARLPGLVARFEQEARVAGALESEHITRVLDLGRDGPDGAPFLAMEYLVGEDLQRLFDRLGPVPGHLAVRFGIQACLGLEKAHAAGIVHRDIKPANLFLAEGDGEVRRIKILDFGIAKVTEDAPAQGPAKSRGPMTRTGSVLGSPLYMSPEQARGKGHIGPRTDLWSLGIVLYQALSGRTPFDEADSFGDFIRAVLSGPVTPLRAHASWVDPATAAVVERALAFEPEGRYASAAEMRAALEALLPSPADANIRAPMVVTAQPGWTRPVRSTTSEREAVGTKAASPAAIAGESAAAGASTVMGAPLLSGLASPSPSPSSPPPGWPATVAAPPPPGPTVSDAFGPVIGGAPIVPPVRASKSKSGGGSLVPVLVTAGLLALVGGGLATAYGLGAFDKSSGSAGPDEAPSARPSAAPSPGPSVAAAPGKPLLEGTWWGENGVAYDAVTVGDTVELRFADLGDSPTMNQGWSVGDAQMVLRPIAGDANLFRVEARARPAPPRGWSFEGARARSTCVATWSEIGGRPLRAEHAGERLSIRAARVEAPLSAFVREGTRITACEGIAKAKVVEIEIELGVSPPKKAAAITRRDAGAPASDAGSPAGDAGAPVTSDAGAPAPIDAGAPAIKDAGAPPSPADAGTGPAPGRADAGAPRAACTSDAQCPAGRCFSGRCRSRVTR